MSLWLDRYHPALVNDVDAPLPIELRGMQRDPILGSRAGQVILREIRPVVGRVGIRVIQRQPTCVALPSQCLGRTVPRRTGADDDHGIRVRAPAPRSATAVLWLRCLPSDKD